MSDVSMSGSKLRVGSLGASPVFLAWAIVALVLSALWAVGYIPNGDDDDLLKAWQIRHLLETGDIFDRTLPGIAQPESYISHWPWITDAPYAAVTLLLRPLTGQEFAIQAAF